MIFTEVGVRHFRTIDALTLTPHPRLNLIQGDNGSGKSSLLEALQCLATGHSFRTRQPRELIAFDSNAYSINATFIDSQTQQEHRAGLEKSRDGSVTLRLDYEPVKTQSEITQLLPLKLLTPDSHFLIQQGPDERRTFLDWGLFHVKHEFFTQWKIYRRALSQRNQLLKNTPNASDVKSWDTVLAASGTILTRDRCAYVHQLGLVLQKRLASMKATFHVELIYRQGWDENVSLAEKLEANFAIHRKMRTTTDGPHRGDMVVMCNDHKAKQVLSRGQQKLLIYALHFSQLDLIASETNRNSIILCDDMLSELDSHNGKVLLDQITEGTAQTFITGTDISALQSQSHHMFHMEHGLCENRL